MARLTVLDASVILAVLFSDDPHHGDVAPIVETSTAFAMSTITFAEVLVRTAREDTIDAQLARLARLKITEIPIEPGAAPALAQLRAQTGLKLPDCCVLHAAMTAGADAIASRDDRLRAVAATHGFQTP